MQDRKKSTRARLAALLRTRERQRGQKPAERPEHRKGFMGKQGIQNDRSAQQPGQWNQVKPDRGDQQGALRHGDNDVIADGQRLVRGQIDPVSWQPEQALKHAHSAPLAVPAIGTTLGGARLKPGAIRLYSHNVRRLEDLVLRVLALTIVVVHVHRS